ncbi:hypothetical protein PVAP13_7KG034318 [Panicum virgatum]|uniref:Uncharacterized protein n=1 Tax=Panicum virgatum TaxID=38727 RepID=A0A8T0Q7H6_PANVG|nr:hypothetical protein PVAP13_7KG034318 [Panicum virgatum]
MSSSSGQGPLATSERPSRRSSCRSTITPCHHTGSNATTSILVIAGCLRSPCHRRQTPPRRPLLAGAPQPPVSMGLQRRHLRPRRHRPRGASAALAVDGGTKLDLGFGGDERVGRGRTRGQGPGRRRPCARAGFALRWRRGGGMLGRGRSRLLRWQSARAALGATRATVRCFLRYRLSRSRFME